MKLAMVMPTRKSEKVISGYSVDLTKNIRKTGQEIEDFMYDAGNSIKLLKKLYRTGEH